MKCSTYCVSGPRIGNNLVVVPSSATTSDVKKWAKQKYSYEHNLKVRRISEQDIKDAAKARKEMDRLEKIRNKLYAKTLTGSTYAALTGSMHAGTAI